MFVSAQNHWARLICSCFECSLPCCRPTHSRCVDGSTSALRCVSGCCWLFRWEVAPERESPDRQLRMCRQAVQQLPTVGAPFELREFSDGVRVLQSLSHSTRQVTPPAIPPSPSNELGLVPRSVSAMRLHGLDPLLWHHTSRCPDRLPEFTPDPPAKKFPTFPLCR